MEIEKTVLIIYYIFSNHIVELQPIAVTGNKEFNSTPAGLRIFPGNLFSFKASFLKRKNH